MILTICGALCIGLSLGLLGSGGSILTLPILVYVLHRPEKTAIVESLAIVGMIALIGAIPYAKRGQVHWRTVLFFGVAGILGAYSGACLAAYLSGSLQLILFSFFMLAASWMMIKDKQLASVRPSTQPYWLLAIEGFLLGNLTGCIGIGGGFLIVPTLVLLVNLPMCLAVGTSLVIIAFNALTAFTKHYLTNDSSLNWQTISTFIIIGIVGSFCGSLFSTKFTQKDLKKIFGWALVPLAVIIFLQQASLF
ncbi:MAG: sulfite exporter TauE/SafE family protein [Parachlamydia sp.]|nr:sulfite exporter TauE/SafE family protein [Parachlamydia sp.]